MNFGRADPGRISVCVLAGLGFLLLGNTPRDVISKTATAHLQNTHGMQTLSRPSTEGLHAQPHVVEVGGSSPLSFEANAGQTDPRVKFLSRGHGYTLFLTGDEAVLALRKASQESKVEGQELVAQRSPFNAAAFRGTAPYAENHLGF